MDGLIGMSIEEIDRLSVMIRLCEEACGRRKRLIASDQRAPAEGCCRSIGESAAGLVSSAAVGQ